MSHDPMPHRGSSSRPSRLRAAPDPKPRLTLLDVHKTIAMQAVDPKYGSLLDDLAEALVRTSPSDRRQMTRSQLEKALASLSADGAVILRPWGMRVAVDLVPKPRRGRPPKKAVSA